MAAKVAAALAADLPAPPAAPARQRSRAKRPLIALGCLLFLGLIAAIAIPNMLSMFQRGKQDRTVADMRTLVNAIESYAADSDNRYPEAATMAELVPLLEPKYIEEAPRTDAWLNEFRYWGDGSQYVLRSAGKDGVWEQEDPNAYDYDMTYGPDADLVMTMNVLIRGPYIHGEPSDLLNMIPRPNRQKRTLADMRSIATAVEAWSVDNNFYPSASTLDELAITLQPTYIKVLPRQDGWSHDLRYETWKEDPNSEGMDSYAIGSPGKDGKWETPTLRCAAPGSTGSFDCDIIYSNGSFVRYPEGIQK